MSRGIHIRDLLNPVDHDSCRTAYPVTGRLSVDQLLNPVDDNSDNRCLPNLPTSPVDIYSNLATLVDRNDGPIMAPPLVASWLLNYLRDTESHTSPSTLTDRQQSTASSPSSFSLLSFPQIPTPSSIKHNVYLNHKTTISTLYTYKDVNTYLEYPESSDDKKPVGHLFRLDPHEWQNPAHNFAYSLGYPSGRTKSGEDITCALLFEGNSSSQLVPCIRKHFTCESYMFNLFSLKDLTP